ncbi:MAG TPA: LysR family transcriptional regulator [Candidatus Dormibacteraeota bacterium]|nr:LysR family transcriptional regulator [Candidatus Dormibacteraeota bacterium]
MSKPSFTVEQVRSFLAVAEHEHVSRAAASLHLTQGAVTQQVHNFERAVGVRLLERDGRGVRLTEAGRGLAISCRAALRAFEVVEDSARALKMLEAGSLHLGASPTCATHYLPPRLADFNRQFPGITLSVTVEPSRDINNQVKAGALDCGLIEGEPFPDLVSLVLTHDELVLVVRRDHPLARLKRVTSAQLAKHRYLGRGREWSAESTVRTMIGEAYEQSEVLNLGHPEYVRAAALAGLGYAALPMLAIREDLEAGALTRLPMAPVTRPIHAIRRSAQGGPTLEEFWRLLVRDAKAK